jgi:hypothetical protein
VVCLALKNLPNLKGDLMNPKTKSPLLARLLTAQHQLAEARTEHERLDRESRQISAAKRTARRKVQDAENELGVVAALVDRSLSEAGPETDPPSAPATTKAKPARQRRSSPHVPPSLAQALRAIPQHGRVTLGDVVSTLGIAEGTARSRLARLKKSGLVQSAGWGVIELTAEGRAVLGKSKLKVVE